MDTSKISAASKIPGIYYFEYTNKDSGKVNHIPSSPPFTTWSGLMACPLEGEHGEGARAAVGDVERAAVALCLGEHRGHLGERAGVKGARDEHDDALWALIEGHLHRL
jgi:hypothetical protein